MASNKAGVVARSRRHLRDAGLGYWAHLARAGGVGLRMIGGGAAALIHAVVPGLFTWTASRTVRTLDARLTATRRRGGPDLIEAPIETRSIETRDQGQAGRDARSGKAPTASRPNPPD